VGFKLMLQVIIGFTMTKMPSLLQLTWETGTAFFIFGQPPRDQSQR